MSDPSAKRRGKARERAMDLGMEGQIEAIKCLNILEDRSSRQSVDDPIGESRASTAPVSLPPPAIPSTLSHTNVVSEVTDRIVSAISPINSVRSNHIISNFDPSLNDIEV